MRVALFSDIHGECYPLDHVIRDIRRQGIDRLVCLGDALQGGAQPTETLARLRELACPIVMGNADAWMVSGKETSTSENTSEKQKEVRKWSLSRFSESDLDYIQSFLPTVEIELEGGKKLLCFHGSPRSFDDIILPSTPDETVRLFFLGNNATFFAGGHTHTQQIRRVGDSWYINPGSVSLAYNWEHSNVGKGIVSVDPWADYAIIASEEGNLGVTFRHVPYDVEELGKIIRNSGRPYAEEVISEYRRK